MLVQWAGAIAFGETLSILGIWRQKIFCLITLKNLTLLKLTAHFIVYQARRQFLNGKIKHLRTFFFP